MRCKNCGWENPDGLTKCEKCGAVLQSVNEAQNYQCTVHEVADMPKPLNQTACEGGVWQEPVAPAAMPQAPVQTAPTVCPNCGYPLRAGAMRCPNCGTMVNESAPQEPVAAQYKAPNRPQEIAANPMTGTVNPRIQVAPAAKCSLEPIAQEGAETPKVCELKGDLHELNRANLDPENLTITSKVQAQLVCEQGQWFIEDKSQQHTTFVYVGSKTPLQEGDIILMGNREFVFHIK